MLKVDDENLREHEAALEKYSLRELISLFSEPHVFLRELVQNALDAQTLARVTKPIEITTSFDAYNENVQRPIGLGRGLFTLQVLDRGTGMNKRDIDEKLVQLFNTTKKDDKGLIGSHGIGFLSTFAFNPSAVIVDTGREGEAVKLLFKANARFDRIPSEFEFTGTKVQVIKEIEQREVELLLVELRSTLNHWCKMATTEIRFNGSSVNQPFSYADSLAWCSDGPGDTFNRLAVRPRADTDRHYEIYRNGILLENDSDEELSLPGITYRVDSTIVRNVPGLGKIKRDYPLKKLLREVSDKIHRQYIPYLVERSADLPTDDAWAVISYYLPILSNDSVRVPLIPADDGSKLSLLEIARQIQKNKLKWTSSLGTKRIVLWDGVSPGLRRVLVKCNQVRGSFGRTLVNRLYPARDVDLSESS